MDEREGERHSITVQQLFEFNKKRLRMKLAAGAEGLQREISNARVQKTGLALANFVECCSRERVQILGRTEMRYLEQLEENERERMLEKLFGCELACFLIAAGGTTPDYLRRAADASGTPLFTTELDSVSAIDMITHFLDLQLAPRATIHGNLLDIFGLGVLLIGESGVGKSECAIELVARGHRLVADDVMEISLVENEVLLGSCPEKVRYLMELRGIGVIDIKALFGVGSVRESKKIELVIKLEHWRQGIEYSRLGIREKTYAFLGIELPYVIMPVAPGRNLSILVEVAARNQLMKLKGVNVARRVTRRLDRELQRPAPSPSLKEGSKGGVGLFE